MNKCSDSCPCALVTYVQSALVALLTTNAKLQDNCQGKKVLKKAGSGVQCHKKVVERQIQYTHTQFCYLVLEKNKNKNNGRRARHSNRRAPIHPELCLHCYERGKPSSPKLGTPKYPAPVFFSSHQVFGSKCCLEVVLRLYSLTTPLHQNLSFLNKKWQFGKSQFLGVVISTISVSLLNMRIMLQHITPPAYGSVKLSVVHFHHLSPPCLFLKTKQPFLQLTFTVTSQCV